MLFGVIDVGSTSVRLMLTDGRRVEKRVNTTRLAENMGEMNTLQPVSIERTAQAVAEYYFVAMQNGAEDVYAYATEAVRSAKNKYKFVDRVRELCGLEIDILDKTTEAEIGYLGASTAGRCCVVDMGGASTELSVGNGENIVYSKSLPYGIVRLSAIEREKIEMTPFINDCLMGYGDVPAFDKVVAIGGTISTMAAIKNELEIYDPNVVNGCVLTINDISEMYEKINAMPLEERRRVKGLPEKRADIIAPGILMYSLILKYLGADYLTVSEGDGAEGYLIKLGVLPRGFRADYSKIL